jgi:hypothetical protein
MVSKPTITLRSGSHLAMRPARISWQKMTSVAPLKTYKVQRRIDGGDWQDVAINDPKATSVTVALDPGRTHQFRVHGVDGDGVRGRWATGPTRRAKLKGPRDSTLSGSESGPSDGVARRARLEATFWSVAFVAPVGPGMGKAVIKINGRKVGTIDLGRPEKSSRQLVWARNWRRAKERVIVVKPVRSDVRVVIDGFLVLR